MPLSLGEVGYFVNANYVLLICYVTLNKEYTLRGVSHVRNEGIEHLRILPDQIVHGSEKDRSGGQGRQSLKMS